ncbi:MAG: ribosome silencing factor [Bdellovibrionales bacterium]
MAIKKETNKETKKTVTVKSKKAPPAKKVAASKPQKKVASKTTGSRKKSAKAETGLPEQIREAALKVLDERKALDIVCVDLRGRSAIADYAIIASGGSARQLGALAEYLREAFFKLGIKKLRVEGLPQGDWVLVDAGDVVIHLFRPEVRDYYQLEDIWSAQNPSAV